MTVSENNTEKTVCIDLGICHFAALAFEDQKSELYPLNCLKQDDYYYSKHIARCDDSTSEETVRLNAKKSNRRTHSFHTLSKHIVERCVDENVGVIAIGDLSGIREDEDGATKNWGKGKHGNLDLDLHLDLDLDLTCT
jgi:transposase